MQHIHSVSVCNSRSDHLIVCGKLKYIYLNKCKFIIERKKNSIIISEEALRHQIYTKRKHNERNNIR